MTGDDEAGPRDNRRYQLEGLAVPESLELLHSLLDQVRREHPEIDRTDLMLFETAIVEIHGNVVQHGRPPGGLTYMFTLAVDPGRLAGTLCARGEPLPDSALPGGAHHGQGAPDPMAEDGRGLWLAGSILDSLDYSREGEHNVWRMNKALPAR